MYRRLGRLIVCSFPRARLLISYFFARLLTVGAGAAGGGTSARRGMCVGAGVAGEGRAPGGRAWVGALGCLPWVRGRDERPAGACAWVNKSRSSPALGTVHGSAHHKTHLTPYSTSSPQSNMSGNKRSTPYARPSTSAAGQAPKRRGKKNKSLLDTPISELVPSKVLQTSTPEIILDTALSAIIPTEIPEINFDESLFDLSAVSLNREENDVLDKLVRDLNIQDIDVNDGPDFPAPVENQSHFIQFNQGAHVQEQQEMPDETDYVFADILDPPKDMDVMPHAVCLHQLPLNYQQTKRVIMGVDLKSFTPFFFLEETRTVVDTTQ